MRTIFATFQVGFLARLSSGDAKKPLASEPLLSNGDRSPTEAFFLPSSIPTGAIPTPRLNCPPADYRGWKTWSDVGAGMQKAPSCAMCQSWLSVPEQKLRPASVAVAHHGNELIVYAELIDDDIFNPVKTNGLDAFTRGDVIEIFLRAENEDNYIEHHITPDNYILQLRWPSVTVVNKLVEESNAGKHVDYLSLYASHIPIRNQTLVQPELRLWRALAVIPLELLTSHPKEIIPREWSFSFSRYDYTHGQKQPILSSTSALKAPNFHELASWGRLTLV
jgi:hypothetical protein